MARFSLSPPSTSSIKQREEQQQQSKDVPQWKWTYPPQDGYSYRQSSIQYSSTDESSVSSDDDSSIEEAEQSNNKDDESSNINDDDEDDEEEEPPHPLGFEKYGKTRFGLSPQSTSNTFNNRTPTRGDIFNRDDEYAWNALIHIDDKKKVGGNNSLIPTYHLKSRDYIPTSNLLAGATSLQ